MRKFIINQTGPAIGTGEVCYMAGEDMVEFFGTADNIMDAIALIHDHTKDKSASEAFTIQYNPWRHR